LKNTQNRSTLCAHHLVFKKFLSSCIRGENEVFIKSNCCPTLKILILLLHLCFGEDTQGHDHALNSSMLMHFINYLI